MHEMSIATNILEIAEDSMDGHQNLLSITVQVGQLAGVELDALKFCFEALKTSSRYPGLMLVIDEIPGQGKCQQCGATVPMNEVFAVCSECGNYGLKPIRGQELRVSSIEVD